MISVLVVDDSRTAREWTKRTISNLEGLEVIGEASEGRTAFELTQKLRPDVIIMDMDMPGVNGLHAIRDIMANCPTPIIILSSAKNRGLELDVVDGIRSGALHAIEKPDGSISQEAWKYKFEQILRAASRVEVMKHKNSEPAIFPSKQQEHPKPVELIAIGASAGGPVAVANILSKMPPLSIPIVVILHFPEGHNSQLLRWYSSVLPMPVVEIADGDSLAKLAGKICLAQPGRHLIVRSGSFRFTDDPPRHFCKPSIDTFFDSIAESYGKRSVVALLTGMGRDGAQGLLKIRQAGGRTIAQDEASSLVFGMPKAAIELAAVEYVLPEEKIAEKITDLITESTREFVR